MFKQPYAGSLFTKHVRVIIMPVVCNISNMGSSERPLLERLGHQASPSGSNGEIRQVMPRLPGMDQFSLFCSRRSTPTELRFTVFKVSVWRGCFKTLLRVAARCVDVYMYRQYRGKTDGAENLAEHLKNQTQGFSSQADI
jgi:hypothetical protein